MVDLNPLHWISKANHAFGDTMASGLEFLGITDPAVDPDGVREIAKHWRSLAKGLEDAAHAAEVAMSGVTWEGETAKAFSKRARTMRKHATDTAHSMREGATALDKFADEAHELITQIGVMVAEIAEFEIAGLALSVLTAGMSEVASTLVAGERALKVMALITRIEESGSALGATVRTAMEAIRNVERALKALKEIKTIAKIGKLASEGAKFTAFTTALEDPGAFKDPGKLAKLLTEGAIAGVGLGFLGKALGKGLKALKPGEIADLAKALKLNGSGLSRLKLRPSEWEKLPASIRGMFKECKLDPIDVATGDMLLPQTDLSLPGTLPLILERTHISSYRWGGWFGPSWASTLDQRLQIDDQGVIYTTPDGARLIYPHPDPDSNNPVYPETGSRLALTWDTETDGALTITDPDTGHTHTFHTPQPTNDGQAVDLPLQTITDRNNQRITLHYTDNGTPTHITHTGGYHLTLDHHPTQPRITALRLIDPSSPDPSGTLLRSYQYNDEGHLTHVQNSCGLNLKLTYDPEGRITSWTDSNNTHYRYTYDQQGRVTRTEGSGGYLNGTLTYNDTTHTTTVTNSLGHTSHYQHNNAYRLIRTTDALGYLTEQEWDTENRLTAVTDPLGHTTRYTYDEQGRTASVVRPDGRTATTDYNGIGRPTTVTSPDGSSWVHEYDARGNPTAITEPTGATTRYTHNGAGHLTSITDALGNTTRIRSNRAGLPVEIIDPLNAATRYERDSLGRPTALTNPLGHTTRLEWTLEGKPLLRIGGDRTRESWTYDGEGNCTSHTGVRGEVSRFEYTHFDLLSARTGPDGIRQEFSHDTELQLTKVTNPQALTWEYHYDALGRIASETDFDGRTLSYRSDAAGRLSHRTNGVGATIRYERNPLGQTTLKDVAGAVTTFEYDSSDALMLAVGPGVTSSYTRGPQGRLESETVNGRTLSFEYDDLGRRTHRTTPGGAVSEWIYDAASRRTGLTASGHSLAFSYDAAGQEVSRDLGTALTLSHTFDELGRLTNQRVTSAGRDTLLRSFTYRSDGYPTSIEDLRSGTRRFDLDISGRVTAVHATNWTEKYAYDEAGNQISASWPATSFGTDATGEREYAGTRITRAGNVRYEHDAQGRIVLRQKTRLSRKPDTWRYTWDAEDRLISVVTPDGTVWRYLYDPLGRRIAKQRMAADAETVVEQIDFTWDGSTLCEQTTSIAELSTHVTVTWDHNNFLPLAQTERVTSACQEEVDERFFAIVTDLVGAPSELIDEEGNTAWHTKTTLWGATSWNTNARAYTPLRFPGQYYDPETGLHYNYFRHYDPETARYLSVDPLGLTPAPNPTAYVRNPHVWSDPLGLAPCFAEQKSKALRDAGVPEGTKPFDVNEWTEATTPAWQGSKRLLGPDGKPIFYTTEWYETPSGDIVVFQDHWFGHQEPGTPGHQPAHVHVRPYDNDRNGQIPGCEEHYYYDVG
ncbi:DUF6531 domain-containing protein [Streptomyces sp. NBC_01197]|uniref:DUF6531 domain-containing protein n=1 Tax=Streptomyces sp. NBC_01197 TaxID=2903768 RepID=UPI002E139751|nr:DUF6531 domain-containing protein [Streptomyces sp. NBC_01197]